MATKTELNWINMQATALTGDMEKAWNTLEKAREAFKASIVAHARKAKAIDDSETLAIAVKPWGFAMAKTANKTAKAQAKSGSMFSNL